MFDAIRLRAEAAWSAYTMWEWLLIGNNVRGARATRSNAGSIACSPSIPVPNCARNTYTYSYGLVWRATFCQWRLRRTGRYV